MLQEFMIVRLFMSQSKLSIGLSFLVGLLYFLLPTAVSIILVANFVLLYYYYLIYFLVVLFMITSLVLFHSTDRFIESLLSYEYIVDFDYEKFAKRINVISVIILFLAHCLAYYIIINQ